MLDLNMAQFLFGLLVFLWTLVVLGTMARIFRWMFEDEKKK